MCWQIPFSMRICVLTCRRPPALCVLTWRRESSLFLFLLMKPLIPIGGPSRPHLTLIISPKPNLQNHHFGVRASTYEFGEWRETPFNPKQKLKQEEPKETTARSSLNKLVAEHWSELVLETKCQCTCRSSLHIPWCISEVAIEGDHAGTQPVLDLGLSTCACSPVPSTSRHSETVSMDPLRYLVLSVVFFTHVLRLLDLVRRD